MSKSITRRDLLKFTGGGLLGIMFSPLPWKLMDDSAIWTQNWSLTPPLSHGPISTRFTHCTLCAGGCAIKAQCVSGIPFFISGVQNHTDSHGALCTRGIASHHMAYHPLRIVHPHKFTEKSGHGRMVAVSLQESLEATVKHINDTKGSIAVIDQQPNRAISEIYRGFLRKIPNGKYLSSPSTEDETIIALKKMMNLNTESYGFDFEKTRMILSFGAALLDGWGTPGRMATLRNKRGTTFIQIDSRYSRTAMQSDQWIALKPRTELVLALNIAHVLVFEDLIHPNVKRSFTDFDRFTRDLREFNPEKTFSTTGIEADVVKALASRLAKAESAIVLSGADPGGGPFDPETIKAIAILNLLIGSVGKTGGIISRREIPGYTNTNGPEQWQDIPDHSIVVLIVDGADSGYALPWKLIERKLVPGDNFIVSLSPVLNELSAHSDYLIPSPGHLETLSDVPNPADSTTASFALSSPLLRKQDHTTEPADVIKGIAERLGVLSDIPDHDEMLKQKVKAIHSQKRGTLFFYSDGRSEQVNDVPSEDDLWMKLSEGARWTDEQKLQSTPTTFTFGAVSGNFPERGAEGFPLIVHGWRGAVSTSQISPILSKVFQETELRHVNGIVMVHPATADHCGISNDESAQLTTKNGTMNVTVKISPSVRPGVIEASIGPLPNGIESPLRPSGANILNLCEIRNDGTWRITGANLYKV